MKGKFNINNKVWPNHIMDAGVKKMMRAISSTSETNTLLLWMSVGTGSTSPDDTTRTALVAEVGIKYDVGTTAVNSVYPFDLELSIIIPSDAITAGTVLKEIAVWWGPTGTKELFARAVNSTGVTVVSGNALPITYELNII